MKTKIPQTKNEAFAQLDAMLSEEEKNFKSPNGLELNNQAYYSQTTKQIVAK